MEQSTESEGTCIYTTCVHVVDVRTELAPVCMWWTCVQNLHLCACGGRVCRACTCVRVCTCVYNISFVTVYICTCVCMYIAIVCSMSGPVLKH